MNIIELVKDILQQFPKISEVCNDIHIDFTDDTPPIMACPQQATAL